MKIDSDPLQTIEAHYAEPADINMAMISDGPIVKSIMISKPTEATKGFRRGIIEAADGLTIKLQDVCITEGAGVGVNVIEVSPQNEMEVDPEPREIEEQAAFPEEGETLLDFLCRCHRNISEVMICPKCSGVFDRKAVERIEGSKRFRNKEKWRNTIGRHRADPRGKNFGGRNQQTFKPPMETSKEKWTRHVQTGSRSQSKWRSYDVRRGSSIHWKKETQAT